jgi:Mn2+/Fe2+ NRAMP family transporter
LAVLKVRPGRLLPLFAVVGPGLITAAADNDAGGITTYSVVGAQFGYSFLWVVVILLISLAITQEMGARAGIVTGKGLASLIRERFVSGGRLSPCWLRCWRTLALQ